MPAVRHSIIPLPAGRGPWRRLAALRAGLRAALRALRANTPKR